MPKVNKEDLCIVYYEVEGEFSVLWKANPNNKKKRMYLFSNRNCALCCQWMDKKDSKMLNVLG